MFHDAGDHKFNNDPEKVFVEVSTFLHLEGYGNEIIDKVLFVARNISYSLGDKRGAITPLAGYCYGC